MAASSVYSCGTCRVKFPSLELMQTHYKCDWHRYNLKRKVAELPPVSAENFAEILKAYQNDPAKKASAGLFGGLASDLQGDKLYCKICTKSFLNSGSFASHLDSKKHVDRLKLTGSEDDSDLTELSVVSEDRKVSEKGVSTKNEQKDVEMADNEDDWEDEDDDEEVEIPPYDTTLCLFCSKKHAKLELNLSHMSSSHTFFVPDFEYCIDPAGLIDYLGKKVTDGHMCLYCNQRFQNTTAAQRHMDSKGHTKMAYEGESLLEYEEFYDFTRMNQDDSSMNVDGEGVVADIDGTGFEMTLPSGVTIGHRDLNRYYKQSLRPVKDVALVTRVVGHYKALGWKSNQQGMGYAKNMLKELNRLKKDNLKKRLHVGMQTNKIMMEHYRRQYGF